jgi:hypothetical protein
MRYVFVEDAVFEQELQRRLHMIESQDAGAIIVSDLPLLDIAVIVIALVIVTAGLMWWAY